MVNCCIQLYESQSGGVSAKRSWCKSFVMLMLLLVCQVELKHHNMRGYLTCPATVHQTGHFHLELNTCDVSSARYVQVLPLRNTVLGPVRFSHETGLPGMEFSVFTLQVVAAYIRP